MVDYGKFVDEGTKYITPREFFLKVIEKEADRYLEDFIGDALEEQIAQALGFK